MYPGILEIYLIRHTTPDIPKGICYGQSDIPLATSFAEEAEKVLGQLPAEIDAVHSSPLSRCVELASTITDQAVELVPELQEMNFGEWELKPWSDIPKDALDPWMKDFVNHQIPNGESMQLLARRVNRWYDELLATNSERVVIVTHAGPIRVLLSTINQTPLEEAFDRYPVDYGQVTLVH